VTAETNQLSRPAHLLTISARDEVALRELVKLRRDELASGAVDLADAAYTANNGRTHFAQRLALVASGASEAVAQLDAFLVNGAATGVHTGKASMRAPKIGFLFAGQGAQHAGMTRSLYDTQPVFRAALDRCDAILADKLPKRLKSVIYASDADADLINDTEYTQPALFAVEFALTRLWASWGIEPAVVLGHSVGEYVAACVAGVLSLEDSLSLVAQRGRFMGTLPRNGAMVAVMAEPAFVREAIAPYSSELSIAAINGPRNVVISGSERSIADVLVRFEAEGVSASRLKVSHAFHSPLMAPIAHDFERVSSAFSYAPPSIDLVTNLTGGIAGPSTITANYLRRQLLEPVQFASGVDAMLAAGCTAFLEIGPHPTLTAMGRQCAPDAKAAWISSLRRDKEDSRQLLEAAASLYTQGASIDWLAFDAPWNRRRVTLASYPFQRSRYWVDTVGPVVPVSHARPRLPVDDLPARVGSMLRDVVWQPGVSKSGLIDPISVSQVVEPEILQLAELNNLDAYADFLVGLDELASRYIVRALADLGYPLRSGEEFAGETLRADLGVLERHSQLFGRMLAILAEDGILARRNDMWLVVRDDASLEAEPLVQ
jgi:acyl transferase domain-containing protein